MSQRVRDLEAIVAASRREIADLEEELAEQAERHRGEIDRGNHAYAALRRFVDEYGGEAVWKTGVVLAAIEQHKAAVESEIARLQVERDTLRAHVDVLRQENGF
ncbi:MAG: hypothetical protein ACTH31_14160 [Pseudoclavibacter sp.]